MTATKYISALVTIFASVVKSLIDTANPIVHAKNIRNIAGSNRKNVGNLGMLFCCICLSHIRNIVIT